MMASSFVDYNALRLVDLKNYYQSGSRFYGYWKSLPQNREGLQDVLGWIRFLLTGIVMTNFYVAEVHPNGGLWTHVITQMMYNQGIPRNLTYYVLGSDAEHQLTLRDSIKTLDKSIRYNFDTRIRTYRTVPREENPNLISNVKFVPEDAIFLNKLQDKLDVVFCFESLDKFLKPDRRHHYNRCCKSLKEGGTYIGSTGFQDRQLDIALLEENGMKLLSRTVSHGGHFYFQAIKESIE